MDAIKGKNQMQFDEKLVKHIITVIMGDTLPNDASLKIYRDDKIQKDSPKGVNTFQEHLNKLGHDLYAVSEIAEEIHISPSERDILINGLNAAIKTYMELLNN
ncbi:MAG: hypothetical protein PHQ95_02990 [Candidatus Gracilibacteria bacterium]|nr:hypothetical protein [Candidatus Gracilibacteria bacterium]